MNTNALPTPIQPTKAHQNLYLTLHNLAVDVYLYDGAHAEKLAVQTLADSEARAVGEQTNALALMVLRCDAAEKQVRALEVDQARLLWAIDHPNEFCALFEDIKWTGYRDKNLLLWRSLLDVAHGKGVE